ncbi:MAG: hypothetical protein H7838_12840 [Magnetococcus sp. DMHC-8]
MFNGDFFESTRITTAQGVDGRYRLVYAGTGNLFLNLMGGPVDGGGYNTAYEATRQANRFNSRLKVVMQTGNGKPGTINTRAVALMML